MRSRPKKLNYSEYGNFQTSHIIVCSILCVQVTIVLKNRRFEGIPKRDEIDVYRHQYGSFHTVDKEAHIHLSVQTYLVFSVGQLSFQYQQNLLCLIHMANTKKACVLKRKAF